MCRFAEAKAIAPRSTSKGHILVVRAVHWQPGCSGSVSGCTERTTHPSPSTMPCGCRVGACTPCHLPTRSSGTSSDAQRRWCRKPGGQQLQLLSKEAEDALGSATLLYARGRYLTPPSDPPHNSTHRHCMSTNAGISFLKEVGRCAVPSVSRRVAELQRRALPLAGGKGRCRWWWGGAAQERRGAG